MDDRFQDQLPAAVVMVRPAAFGFNPETASTNAFQNENTELTRREIGIRARREFDLMVERLRHEDVEVMVFEDSETPAKPDAVFPNNWISFHHDGTVVLYSMFAPSRRPERRRDIVQQLRAAGYGVSRTIDLSHHENEERYLEGTGSIVFDHVERRAFAGLSARTDASVLAELCEALGYSYVTFRATDARRREIYHTNVMMSIAEGFAVLCRDSIADAAERRKVEEAVQAGGRRIVNIEFEQLERFAGNILQLRTKTGAAVTAMSTAALLSFTPAQRRTIERSGPIVESPIPIIEAIEGGSARCMLAGIHLPRTR
jgi:hypothetical protein